ncbi:MAG: glyoxalase [Luteibaculaceae bacterium]
MPLTPESRNEHIYAIRPLLEIDNTKLEAIGVFMNKTLRPILKFQNPLILSLMKHYVHQHNKTFNALNLENQRKYVRHVLKKDYALAKSMCYMVIALYTTEELEFHLEHSADITKRINEMIIERVSSQIEFLY